jgi:hypothetical protein
MVPDMPTITERIPDDALVVRGGRNRPEDIRHAISLRQRFSILQGGIEDEQSKNFRRLS